MLQVNPSLAASYPSQLLHCNTLAEGSSLPAAGEQLNNDGFIHSLLLLSPAQKECPPRGDTRLRRELSYDSDGEARNPFSMG